MAKALHIDVETYSSIDIKKAGAYKYSESVDFEILMIAYAFDDGPIKMVDLAAGEKMPQELIYGLRDHQIEKHAHNATFERNAFKQLKIDIPIEEWRCSMVKAAYCGLPLSLGDISSALKLEEKGKLSTGRALIKYFCTPCKPSKVNGHRHRNMYYHDPEKWEEFKEYCVRDVEAEREICKRLKAYKIPEFEKRLYILDQLINDRGIKIDIEMAKAATHIDNEQSKKIKSKLIDLTGLENPGSPAQLKKWLSDQLQKEVTTLAKKELPKLLEDAGTGPAKDVLILRQKGSKTSTKKYVAMQNCICDDGRAHGLFQFYGANRTGRWAGRLIQLQNLPQNHLADLEGARSIIASGNFDLVEMAYENISSTLSQLIRTAFIAEKDKIFAVADFSAIEARVIAWLAGETWREDVFRSHGKIYEASAAMMFNVPIETIHKGSDLRSKGKVAELALGFGGSVGALKQMGGEKMGLSEPEMKDIVRKWRGTSPNIVKFWKGVESSAIRAVKTRKKIECPSFQNIAFEYDGNVLTIQLPSGRKLFYQTPAIGTNKWGRPSLKYKGLDQQTKKWWWVETYGGKLVENIVQATARDLLAAAMMRLHEAGFYIVMHVHDEAVAEVPNINSNLHLQRMCEIMGEDVSWAKGLPLNADGYLTPFYKKD